MKIKSFKSYSLGLFLGVFSNINLWVIITLLISISFFIFNLDIQNFNDSLINLLGAIFWLTFVGGLWTILISIIFGPIIVLLLDYFEIANTFNSALLGLFISLYIFLVQNNHTFLMFIFFSFYGFIFSWSFMQGYLKGKFS